MIDKLDSALTDLTEIAIHAVAEAKASGRFSKDMAEAVCMIFSMAYGRWQGE